MSHARRAAIVTLLSSAVFAGGCGLAGYVAGVMPRWIEPVYEPADTLTVVVVDDPAQQLPTIRDASLIADRVALRLREERIITRFVESARVDELRLGEPGFAQWSLTRIGAELGAAQVIFVNVTSMAFPGDAGMVRPIASAQVKVLDVGTDRRVFPDPDRRGDMAGYPVSTAMFFNDVSPTSGVDVNILRRDLALELAEDVAELFYKHADEQEPPPGGSL